MNQRFLNEEIRRVSENYADNELYRAISSIGMLLESELPGFGLCSEECFMEVQEVLSLIAERGEDILPDLDRLWLRKYNEYRRLERERGHEVDEEETRKVVGIVFAFAILALNSSSHSFYHTKLTYRLNFIIGDHDFEGWGQTLGRIFEVPFPDGWFESFIDESCEAATLPLPPSLNTERAQTYFRKAMDKGWLKQQHGKLAWMGTGKKPNNSQLAYLCGRIYNYQYSITGNIGEEFPGEELERLFGVTRLYSSLTQVYNAQKKQQWRTLIDELFE